MTNKKCGVPKKYKDDVKTTRIYPLIPTETRTECLMAIAKIVKKYER